MISPPAYAPAVLRVLAAAVAYVEARENCRIPIESTLAPCAEDDYESDGPCFEPSCPDQQRPIHRAEDCQPCGIKRAAYVLRRSRLAKRNGRARTLETAVGRLRSEWGEAPAPGAAHLCNLEGDGEGPIAYPPAMDKPKT